MKDNLVVEPHTNIWQMQSQRDITQLIAALGHPDAEIRRQAAMALRALDAVQTVPALKAALTRETDIQVRVSLQVAIQSLGASFLPDDASTLTQSHDVQGLLRGLHGHESEQTIAAARALGELGDRLAVEPLVILFHDSSASPAERLAAAEALLALKSAPAVATLLGALRRKSWQVRCNAAAVLGQIRAVWAVDALEAALDDRNPLVRRAATAALRQIGTEDALIVLQKRSGSQPEAQTNPGTIKAPISAHWSSESSKAQLLDQQPSPEVVLDSALHSAATSTEAGQRSPLKVLERPVNRLINFLKPRE